LQIKVLRLAFSFPWFVFNEVGYLSQPQMN
jgi:hypothetical protein